LDNSFACEKSQEQEEEVVRKSTILSQMLGATLTTSRQESSLLDGLLSFQGSESISVPISDPLVQQIDVKRTLLSVNVKNVIAEGSVVPLRLVDDELQRQLGISPLTSQVTVSGRVSTIQLRDNDLTEVTSSESTRAFLADVSQLVTIAAPRLDSSAALLVIQIVRHDDSNKIAILPFIVAASDAVISIKEELLHIQQPGLLRRLGKVVAHPIAIHILAGTAVYLAHKNNFTVPKEVTDAVQSVGSFIKKLGS
jgi:hypothetical protein